MQYRDLEINQREIDQPSPGGMSPVIDADDRQLNAEGVASPNSDKSPITQGSSESLSMKAAIFIQVNVMMGMGPLIIPAVFFGGGYLLSMVFLLLIACASYMSAEFMFESMSICNYIHSRQSFYSSSLPVQLVGVEDTRQTSDSKKSLQINKTISKNAESNSTDNKGALFATIANASFECVKKFEISEMAGMLVNPKFGRFIVSPLVIVYLIGVMILKCLLAAKIASSLFEGVKVLESSVLWLLLFFTISAVFSFRNVSNTKDLQRVIFIIRIIIISIMVLATVYLALVKGNTKNSISQGVRHTSEKEMNQGIQLANFSGFHVLFSNGVFAFMMHHSIPSMVKPILPQSSVKNVFRVTFGISVFVFFTLSILGMIAFGSNLVEEKSLKLFHENFNLLAGTKGSGVIMNAVYAFASFYAFLNVTALPVMTITARETLLALIYEGKDSDGKQQNAEETGIERKRKTLASVAILLPILIIALIVSDIQAVLNIFGGIFGAILLLLLPPLMVFRGRNIVNYERNPDYDGIKGNFSQVFQEKSIPLIALILGGLVLIYSVFISIF